MLAARLVRLLDHVKPENRRLWAARIAIDTVAGWILSGVILQLIGQGSFFNQLINLISWMAITLTALDVLSTQDVRTQQEEGCENNSGPGHDEPGPEQYLG